MFEGNIKVPRSTKKGGPCLYAEPKLAPIQSHGPTHVTDGLKLHKKFQGYGCNMDRVSMDPHRTAHSLNHIEQDFS